MILQEAHEGHKEARKRAAEAVRQASRRVTAPPVLKSFGLRIPQSAFRIAVQDRSVSVMRSNLVELRRVYGGS